jgi:hypothetical protein
MVVRVPPVRTLIPARPAFLAVANLVLTDIAALPWSIGSWRSPKTMLYQLYGAIRNHLVSLSGDCGKKANHTLMHYLINWLQVFLIATTY